GSYVGVVALVSLFFVGYYAYATPYQALVAELVPVGQEGRAQGAQALARGAGLGLALVGGGTLLALWTPLPFVLAGTAVVVATAALARGMRGERAAVRVRPAPQPLLK